MSTTPHRLHTGRLCLVSGTAELGRAELDEREEFATRLGAEVPPEWPPPLNDVDSMTWFTELLEQHPEAVGWGTWYFLLKRPDGRLTAIGNGGFKGAPDDSGTVEIGYSVLEAHQRQGLAREAVGRLIAWAFSHQRVRRVIAQTLPDLWPSIRVLEKLGFRYVGEGLEEGAILYELERP